MEKLTAKNARQLQQKPNVDKDFNLRNVLEMVQYYVTEDNNGISQIMIERSEILVKDYEISELKRLGYIYFDNGNAYTVKW